MGCLAGQGRGDPAPPRAEAGQRAAPARGARRSRRGARAVPWALAAGAPLGGLSLLAHRTPPGAPAIVSLQGGQKEVLDSNPAGLTGALRTKDLRRLFYFCASLGLGLLAGAGAARASSKSIALRSVRSCGDALLVVLYVAVDVGVFIVAKWAGGDYHKEAPVLLSSVGSLVAGAAAACATDGGRGLRRALDPRSCLRLLPVAGCFALAVWAQMKALGGLPPMLVKVLFQLKLPSTVFLSTLMLGHRYSSTEVGALAILFLAVTLFTIMRVGGQDSMTGLSQIQGAAISLAMAFAFCAAAVGFNVLATLLGEKAFKDHPDVPWHTTVARVKVGETLVALVLLGLAVPSVLQNPGSAFQAFSWGQCGVTLFLFLDSWITCLVVKRLSAAVKAVSKCMSLVVLYVLSLSENELEPKQAVTVLIIMATTCYFLISVQQRRLQIAKTSAVLSIMANMCVA